jgi:hypothetical protein
MKMSYHISSLGSMASDDLRPDIDGYIHETVEEVVGGNWDAAGWDGDEMPDEMAEEIAEANTAATSESERNIADWQSRNS